MMVSSAQLSVLRMIPVARRIAGAGGDRLAVYRLLNSYRGWDTRHTPVHDIRWALDQLGTRYDGRPVGLVGHSLGGRAALLAAESPQVTSVVALAAYILPRDGSAMRVSGNRLLFVHGLRDRIARPELASGLAEWLGRRNEVGFVAIPRGKHAMLRHGRTFERCTADYLRATLLGERVRGPVGTVLAGERYLQLD
jgi:dienelactone hydrolase